MSYRTGTFLRAIKQRQWKLAAFTLRRILAGALTLRCNQCKTWKGPTSSPKCTACGVQNLWNALFDYDDVPE